MAEGKEDKMRGGGGGVCCQKINKGGMPERVKKTKCGVGGLLRKKFEVGMNDREGEEDKMQGERKKIEGRGYGREGKEDKMRGGVRNKLKGGMPERVKNTKRRGWGVLRKKKLRGVCREGKEDKMRGGGGCEKNN